MIIIACNYDEEWWIRLVLEVGITQQDAQVKFMHPPEPSKHFLAKKRMYAGFHFCKFYATFLLLTLLLEDSNVRSITASLQDDFNVVVNAYADRK